MSSAANVIVRHTEALLSGARLTASA